MLRTFVSALRSTPRGYTQDKKGTIRRLTPKLRGKAAVKAAKKARQRARGFDA